jgi:hypothetical protein
MAKYKINDIIRMADTSDIGYKLNNLYKIVAVSDTGYDLYSFRHGFVYFEEQLQEYITDFLKNQDGYKTVKEFYDNYARLATPAEILLYGKNEN